MKKALTLALTIMAGVAAFSAPSTSYASDHVDGLKTALDNSADITDLYTFTSPRDPSKLVLIMNTHVLAFSGARFSNAVDYKFRIRPIENAQTLTPSSDPNREQSIVCSFTGGNLLNAKQRATCRFNFGGGAPAEQISWDTRTNEIRSGGAAEQNGIKVFAGVRSDSWFLDLIKTVKFNNSQPVANGPGSNGLHGQNILSIAIELDKSRLAGPLLAVTAQTVRK